MAVPASNALSHELDIIEFHALSNEGRKAPGLVLREMQVVRGDEFSRLVRPIVYRPEPALKVGSPSTRAERD